MDYCTFYVDDSGAADWYPPHGKSAHQYHTMAGLILEPNMDLEGKKRTCEILSTYIPESIKQVISDSKYELHFTDLFHHTGIFRKIPITDCQKIIDETFDLIVKLNPVLIATTIDKQKLKQNHGSKAFEPKVLAIQSVVHKFSMHLDRLNKIGAVVYDADKYSFDLHLREAVQDFRRNGINIRGTTYQPRVNKLENILNNVNFCPSYMSSGLQLADFVASAVWRKTERNDGSYYGKLLNLWDLDSVRNIRYFDTLFP